MKVSTLTGGLLLALYTYDVQAAPIFSLESRGNHNGGGSGQSATGTKTITVTVDPVSGDRSRTVTHEDGDAAVVNGVATTKAETDIQSGTNITKVKEVSWATAEDGSKSKSISVSKVGADGQTTTKVRTKTTGKQAVADTSAEANTNTSSSKSAAKVVSDNGTLTLSSSVEQKGEGKASAESTGDTHGANGYTSDSTKSTSQVSGDTIKTTVNTNLQGPAVSSQASGGAKGSNSDNTVTSGITVESTRDGSNNLVDNIVTTNIDKKGTGKIDAQASSHNSDGRGTSTSSGITTSYDGTKKLNKGSSYSHSTANGQNDAVTNVKLETNRQVASAPNDNSYIESISKTDTKSGISSAQNFAVGSGSGQSSGVATSSSKKPNGSSYSSSNGDATFDNNGGSTASVNAYHKATGDQNASAYSVSFGQSGTDQDVQNGKPYSQSATGVEGKSEAKTSTSTNYNFNTAANGGASDSHAKNKGGFSSNGDAGSFDITVSGGNIGDSAYTDTNVNAQSKGNGKTDNLALASTTVYNVGGNDNINSNNFGFVKTSKDGSSITFDDPSQPASVSAGTNRDGSASSKFSATTKHVGEDGKMTSAGSVSGLAEASQKTSNGVKSYATNAESNSRNGYSGTSRISASSISIGPQTAEDPNKSTSATSFSQSYSNGEISQGNTNNGDTNVQTGVNVVGNGKDKFVATAKSGGYTYKDSNTYSSAKSAGAAGTKNLKAGTYSSTNTNSKGTAKSDSVTNSSGKVPAGAESNKVSSTTTSNSYSNRDSEHYTGTTSTTQNEANVPESQTGSISKGSAQSSKGPENQKVSANVNQKTTSKNNGESASSSYTLGGYGYTDPDGKPVVSTTTGTNASGDTQVDRNLHIKIKNNNGKDKVDA